MNFCSFIGRRPHFLENPNNIPNDGEHNQPFQIAGNVLLEDDQDVVADGPERVQGNIRAVCGIFPRVKSEGLEGASPKFLHTLMVFAFLHLFQKKVL